MYIEPNTTIKILGDVRLKKDYKNTLGFDTSTAQYNYFNSKVISGLTLTKQYYQRYDRGVISVNVDVSKLYKADYLMFQNNDFGSKWFYAFINNVEYVSTNVSRIYYEIDVLQSWWFNWDFGECFVERMHTPTDEVGDWLAEEPVTLCNPLYYSRHEFVFGRKYKYIVTCAFEISDINAESYSLEDINGYTIREVSGSVVAYPFNVYELNLEQYEKLIDAIYNTSVDRRSEVIGVRIVPEYFLTSPQTVDVKVPSTVGGYTPNNKKLLTSQFRHLQATTGDVTKNYAYEFLSNPARFWCTLSEFEPDPCIIVEPTIFGGVHWHDSDRLYCKLASTGFTIDTFPSRMMQELLLNIIPTGIESISKIATVAANDSLSAGKLMSAGISTAADIINSVGTGIVKSYLAPNENVGSADGWAKFSTNDYPFAFYHVSIDPRDAKRLDAFFTAYGYQINEIIKPDIDSRERVNYLKTRNCNLINVSCPVDVQDKICSIFDSGVSVWHSPDYLYVYHGEDGALLPNNIV